MQHKFNCKKYLKSIPKFDSALELNKCKMEAAWQSEILNVIIKRKQ